ncbi:MAG: hypothetical protein LBG16_03015 [Elusimicrobiota bacterium]|jgi:hypothetical protein|nr:hypothetical protein [Elusimicrobiota bacterium]MDR0734652.1 hypothetical protein [Elusimicrobiota bacterium]
MRQSKHIFPLAVLALALLAGCATPSTPDAKTLGVTSAHYNKDFAKTTRGLVIFGATNEINELGNMWFNAELYDSNKKRYCVASIPNPHTPAALMLPEGEYYFDDMKISSGNSYMNFGKRFRVAFKVNKGEAVYIGHFYLTGERNKKTGKTKIARFLEATPNVFQINGKVIDDSQIIRKTLEKIGQETGSHITTRLATLVDTKPYIMPKSIEEAAAQAKEREEK